MKRFFTQRVTTGMYLLVWSVSYAIFALANRHYQWIDVEFIQTIFVVAIALPLVWPWLGNQLFNRRPL